VPRNNEPEGTMDTTSREEADREQRLPGQEGGGVTLARGSLYLLVALAAGVALRYGFNFAIARILEPSAYGMFGVGDALLMILNLFVLSAFPWAVARFIAAGRRDVLKASLVGNFALGLLVCGALYGSYALGVVRLESAYLPIVLTVMAATMLLSIANVFVGAAQGTFRFGVVALLRLVVPISLPAVGVCLGLLGAGAPGVMLGYLVGAVITVLLGACYFRGLKFWRGRWVDGEVYLFTGPLLLGVLGTQLLMNVDILGVKFFSEGVVADELAGYYKAVLVLARFPAVLIVALMGAFFPFVSRDAVLEERVRGYSIRLLKYSFVFIFPLCLIIAVMPSQVITLVFPSDYAQGATALVVLSFGMFLLGLATILASFLQALGKATFPAIVLGTAVVLQVVLLSLLVPRYGTTGAAAATSISSGLSLVMLMARYVRIYRPEVRFADFAKLGVSSLVLVAFLFLFPLWNKGLVVCGAAVGYGLYIVVSIVLRWFNSTDATLILSGFLPKDSSIVNRAVSAVAVLSGETRQR